MTLVVIASVLVLVWWLWKGLGAGDPRRFTMLAKTAGGTAALAVAALLVLRGRFDMGLFVGAVGAWLMGWGAYGPLQAYLDRRAPGRVEDAEGDGHAGQGGTAGAGAMSQKEAYEILGLQPGANPEAVREAYRSLMKRIHPDAGGSAGLAARVNQAKEVLLK